MKKMIIITVLVLFVTSCQTQLNIVPIFSGAPRYDMHLKTPIVIAIKDSRPTSENSVQEIETLKSNLKTIYGENVVFRSYFDKTEKNEIALKINIKEVGATFGIRVLQYQSYCNQIAVASSGVFTNWGGAVSTAIISQPIIKNNYIASGYWIGTSYLEIEMIDKFNNGDNVYTFPFVAEDTQNNTWGYRSGKIAAENSWRKVSSHLFNLIDSIAMKIIEYN